MSLAALFFVLAALGQSTSRGSTPGIKRKLAQRVVGFDNYGAPLIPTLLRVAAVYDLPMGIEKVLPVALDRPIHVRVGSGDVAGLLSLCVRQLHGYAWVPEDGAVDIFGKDERNDASNLFNQVLPTFEVRNQAIDVASDQLHRALVLEVLRPKGIVGSFLGNPDLEKRRISLTIERATVRRALNRMVSLDGSAIWIAKVPPKCLTQVQQGGIWIILPHSVQDLRSAMDMGPCRPLR